MQMSQFEITPRNRVRRVSERANYEKAEIYRIIDEALYCHVGFEQGGQPFIIPSIHARIGDAILLHGSKASRLIKHVSAGNAVCVAITEVQGLVLARSIYHHSMNYHSVTLFGRGISIEGDQAKLDALKAFSDNIVPGRWEEVRQPNRNELDETAVVNIPIDTAAAKVRTGPPGDEEEDYGLPIWAGVIPIHSGFGDPIPDPRLSQDIDLPKHIKELSQ
jgi:nitroimidazol reductase NimA-like FMN-containing flavoprotein (pyridoxamine 5'-phosphate oxidase superfamily)